MKQFDIVTVEVETAFGKMPVEFTIIDTTREKNSIYVLYAQGKAVLGQYMVNKSWRLSKPVDLLTLTIE